MTRNEITFEEVMEWYFNALDKLDAELQSIEAKATDETLKLGERYQLSLRKNKVKADIRKLEEAQTRLVKYKREQNAQA